MCHFSLQFDVHGQHTRKACLLYTEVTDFRLCLICQKNVEISSRVRYQARWKNCWTVCVNEQHDPSFLPINSRFCGFQQPEIESHAVSWHRTCYQNAVHAAKIHRAKERFENSVLEKYVAVVTNVKRGCPLIPALSTGIQPRINQEKQKPFTRSSAIQYDNNMCIFCNEDGTKHVLHQVCSFDVEKKIHEIVKKK